MIISEDNLGSIKQDPSALTGRSPTDVAKILSDTRNSCFNKQYSQQVAMAEKCRENHVKAMNILECISKNKNDAVCQLVSEVNYVPPIRSTNLRLVIGVDATCSMSGALNQVLNNIRECVERTYKVLAK